MMSGKMSNEKVVQLKERSQTSGLIDELLEERKQVWSLYCSVSFPIISLINIDSKFSVNDIMSL